MLPIKGRGFIHHGSRLKVCGEISYGSCRSKRRIYESWFYMMSMAVLGFRGTKQELS